jgi:hypothetical protein
MFLTNWLILQIVAAGVTGAVEYPSAADFFMNFDSNNSLYFTGGSKGYASNLILYKGETEYPVYNGSVSNIYISDPETYVSYIQLCNETYVTNTVDVQSVNQVAVYDYTDTTEQKITAGDAATQDEFRVVRKHKRRLRDRRGVRNKNSGTGAAYIYTRNGTTWGNEQKIQAIGIQAGDNFGHSVSISGDYAIVGAHLEDANGSTSSNYGAAYIFKRNGTTWSEQDKLTAGSDASSQDEFGYSVSISGDYAIVGAWRKSSYTGAAYIFKRDTNAETWTQQDKLTTTGSDSQTQDRFGQSVSIDGDYAIISGEGDNTYTGAAYIFKRDTNAETWTQQDKLTASDGLTLSWYGISASISGDYAIVGAYRHPQAGTPQKYGAAYIFKNNGTSWTEQQRLLASDGALSDEFGYSVSISGDYAIIGAHYDDTDGSGPNGSVYIYKLDGTNDVWTEHAKIILSDQTSGTIYGTGDQFGYSVAIDGGYAISGAYNINLQLQAPHTYTKRRTLSPPSPKTTITN